MTDLGLAAFAVYIVANLQMSWIKKARLCALLSLGAL